ncbi:MAG: CvpA family protein [Bryobacteraceae bacterium]|nr:CvpA family protein [Bryobacteraceae bacterium]
MNWFDYLLLTLLAVFVVQGLVRGFSRLAIGLVSTVLGILLAAWFYGVAAGYLKPFIENPAAANICGFLLILAAVQAAGALLAWGVSRLFKTVGLGWLDRLLGAGFGAAKAALVGIALSMILTAFPLQETAPEALAGSRLAPYVSQAAHLLALATPRELRAGFDQTYKGLLDLWERHTPSGASSIETRTF